VPTGVLLAVTASRIVQDARNTLPGMKQISKAIVGVASGVDRADNSVSQRSTIDGGGE